MSWQEELEIWIEKQRGTAGWEQKLENFIQSLLDKKAEEILNELITKQEFVTYKKDGGHGIAVPCAAIFNLLGEPKEEK